MEFYENLENHYDRMTRFKERIKTEKSVLAKWVERYKFQSAIDVACGTGLHSILLAQMGIKTTGVDISETMRNRPASWKEFGGEVTWILSSMVELRVRFLKDMIPSSVSVNYIPHILDAPSLRKPLMVFMNF
jgi:ubiquinone/menaquinone biosynthesis C-methylase UbiE